MANVFDYIEWRGDLTFKQSQFNEIDNLILSRVSYFPFDSLMEYDETITIKEAYNRFKRLDLNKIKILLKEDLDLFPALAQSNRYGNLYLKRFINKRDLQEVKQFSAITIILPDSTAYISYRGTDNTIVGWKEDINMSFMESVPAQIDAKEYLNEIAGEITGKLRVGGHSKGGNLAVYASAFCDENIKKRIIEVYNNDGPGFFEEILKTANYQEILPKVHTYIPQSSIFGRMLNHEEKYTIVKSTQVGVYQHDLYSWQVLGKNFITMEDVTNESEFIDKTLKNWLQEVDSEQREKFWTALFEILASTKAETLSQIKENWLSNSKIILSTYKNLDDETKDIITKTLKSLLGVAKENIKPIKKNN